MTLTQRYLAVFLAVCSMPACVPNSHGATEPLLEGCRRFQATPVLFVHGSGLSSASWDGMIRGLQAAGYPADYLLAVDLDPWDGDNVRAAEDQLPIHAAALADTATASFAASGCAGEAPDQLIVVGHSMGAVSGRWFASRIAPRQTRAMITIAGANHGTDALCGYSGDGNRQMCPAYADDENLQLSLNGARDGTTDRTPYGPGMDRDGAERILPDTKRRIDYLTVRIEPDEWIEPADSATLDGASDLDVDVAELPFTQTSAGNFRFDAKVSHDVLPAHPDMVRFIALILTAIDAQP